MYRHFSSKSALLTALFEELFNELEPPDATQSWRTNLTQLMHVWWRIYRDNHEVAAKLTTSSKAGPGRSRLQEWVATELSRAGVTPSRLEHYQRVICAHVMGYGLLSAMQESSAKVMEQTFSSSVELLLDAIVTASAAPQASHECRHQSI